MKPDSACYFLENKAYFFPPAEHSEGSERSEGTEGTKEEDGMPTADTLPFTCLKTHEAFGPDGDEACEETCGPHRSCYKPEVEL